MMACIKTTQIKFITIPSQFFQSPIEKSDIENQINLSQIYLPVLQDVCILQNRSVQISLD